MSVRRVVIGVSVGVWLLLAYVVARADPTPDEIFADNFEVGGVCPQGRQFFADVCYSYTLRDCAYRSDVTQFANIWGRSSATDAPLPFPGDNVFVVFKNLDKTGYIAAEFTVPTNISPTLTGSFFHGETYPGPNLTMSISSTCGDFNPSPSICLKSNVNGGGALTRYKNAAVPDTTYVGCPLTPGQTYFVNIKATNPNQHSFDCAGNTCRVTVQNNH